MFSDIFGHQQGPILRPKWPFEAINLAHFGPQEGLNIDHFGPMGSTGKTLPPPGKAIF